MKDAHNESGVYKSRHSKGHCVNSLLLISHGHGHVEWVQDSKNFAGVLYCWSPTILSSCAFAKCYVRQRAPTFAEKEDLELWVGLI